MQRAFSLIELLVVISIFSLISLVILANHSNFNSSILLESLAYDVALSVRQAQVYGISVRQAAASPNEFQIGYGVHFSTAASQSYFLFADLNKNEFYNAGSESPPIESYTMGRGHRILRFCAETATGASDCSDDAVNPITFLDVTFFRPEPDANFATDEAGTVYSRARITVSSGAGSTRTITIAKTGQIGVSNP